MNETQEYEVIEHENQWKTLSEDDFLTHVIQARDEVYTLRYWDGNSYRLILHGLDSNTIHSVEDIISRFSKRKFQFVSGKNSKVVDLSRYAYEPKSGSSSRNEGQFMGNPDNGSMFGQMLKFVVDKIEQQNERMINLLEKQQQPQQQNSMKDAAELINLAKGLTAINQPEQAPKTDITSLVDVKSLVTQAVELGMTMQNPKEDSGIDWKEIIKSPAAGELVKMLGGMFQGTQQQQAPQGMQNNPQQQQIIQALQQLKSENDSLKQQLQQQKQPVQQPKNEQVQPDLFVNAKPPYKTTNAADAPEAVKLDATNQFDNVIDFNKAMELAQQSKPVIQPTEKEANEMIGFLIKADKELSAIDILAQEVSAKEALTDSEKEEYYQKVFAILSESRQTLITENDAQTRTLLEALESRYDSDAVCDMLNYLYTKNGHKPVFPMIEVDENEVKEA